MLVFFIQGENNMSNYSKFTGALFAGVAATAMMVGSSAEAKVEGDTITIGSAISHTGKYSTNGIHAMNGYNIAVDIINKTGGVKVGGKSYKLKIKYYDDESTPARGAQLAERLIKQDGVQYMLGRGQRTGFPGRFARCLFSHVGSVRFRCGCQIDNALNQRQLSFRCSQPLICLPRIHGLNQGLWISKANILYRETQ